LPIADCRLPIADCRLPIASLSIGIATTASLSFIDGKGANALTERSGTSA